MMVIIITVKKLDKNDLKRLGHPTFIRLHHHPGCACLQPEGQEPDVGADGAVQPLSRLSNSLLLCRAVEGDPAAWDRAAQGLWIH